MGICLCALINAAITPPLQPPRTTALNFLAQTKTHNLLLLKPPAPIAQFHAPDLEAGSMRPQNFEEELWVLAGICVWDRRHGGSEVEEGGRNARVEESKAKLMIVFGFLVFCFLGGVL